MPQTTETGPKGPPQEGNPSVLMVDDHAENLAAVEVILERLPVALVKAQSGAEALKHLLTQDFAVILLDIRMPGMSGFETAELFWKRERTADKQNERVRREEKERGEERGGVCEEMREREIEGASRPARAERGPGLYTRGGERAGAPVMRGGFLVRGRQGTGRGRSTIRGSRDVRRKDLELPYWPAGAIRHLSTCP